MRANPDAFFTSGAFAGVDIYHQLVSSVYGNKIYCFFLINYQLYMAA